MARTKEFNPDEALGKAMTLFWEQGYEHTSMQDLVTHMGVHKRSMYDTYGDKQALFHKAFSAYVDATEEDARTAVAGATSAREALRALVEKSIDLGCANNRGCLLVNSVTELGTRDPVVAERVERNIHVMRELITQLVVMGQRTGEISADRDADQLARLVHNQWLGMRVQVKAGLTKDDMHVLAADLLSLLD